MVDVVKELKNALNGNPWHGQNVLYLLSSANPQTVFSHPILGAHSIAEIVAHLTAWTEEATDRLIGKVVKEPTKGDWPVIIASDHVTWNVILDDFMISNAKLISICVGITKDGWNTPIVDERNSPLGTSTTYAELINGIVQHHAYHAGQIALLLKF